MNKKEKEKGNGTDRQKEEKLKQLRMSAAHNYKERNSKKHAISK